jgi:tetratricopeptide (TPR) repeat protein
LVLTVRRRNLDYRSEFAAWADTVTKRPLNARAHYNVGNELAELNRFDEAIESYRRALVIRPLYAKARNNLGNTLVAMQRFDDAIAEFEEAIRLGPDPWDNSPEPALPHYNLGNTLLQLGRTDEAERYFREAVKISPRFEPAYTNLAAIYLGQGNVEDAVRNFRAVVELHPERPTAHSNLGVALVKSGRVYEAVRHYRRALELDAGEVTALNNLAWLLAACPNADLRNGAQAVEFATEAVRRSGGRNVEPHRTLAAALAESGRFEEAVQSAQEAINLALRQGNAPLMSVLRHEQEDYRARRPYRDAGATPTDKP